MATLTVKSGPLISQASRYTAPELITNARKADARSDLYAVGAIWYDMVLRPEPGVPIVLEQLEDAHLSFAAHQLMSSLLSSNPEDRPKNAKAVKRWLEQI